MRMFVVPAEQRLGAALELCKTSLFVVCFVCFFPYATVEITAFIHP